MSNSNHGKNTDCQQKVEEEKYTSGGAAVDGGNKFAFVWNGGKWVAVMVVAEEQGKNQGDEVGGPAETFAKAVVYDEQGGQ